MYKFPFIYLYQYKIRNQSYFMQHFFQDVSFLMGIYVNFNEQRVNPLATEESNHTKWIT